MLLRTAKSCGPDAPTLASSSRSCVGPTGLRQNISADDGDKRARSPGRARSKPLKPLRAGMPGYSGGPVVTTLVCSLHHLHARLRVHWAPGIPHALVSWASERIIHNSDASRRGNAKLRRRTLSSSPRKRGSSIPEAAENKSRSRGVLDRPVKPDDDSSGWGAAAPPPPSTPPSG